MEKLDKEIMKQYTDNKDKYLHLSHIEKQEEKKSNNNSKKIKP